MENEEKNIENNTEDNIETSIEASNIQQDEILNDGISEEVSNEEMQETNFQEMTLEEKLASQDEFAFLDNIEEENQEDEESQKEDVVSDLITVRPVKFQQFEATPPVRSIKRNLDIMQDVSMHISVELGKTKSSIREVMDMEEGTIVELDKIAGEQVEVFVNDKLVAKGEVIVIEDKFGVRITSTNIQKTI